MHVERAWRLRRGSEHRVFYTGWMGRDDPMTLCEFRNVVEYIANHCHETHNVPMNVDDWKLHVWLNTLGANLVTARALQKTASPSRADVIDAGSGKGILSSR